MRVTARIKSFIWIGALTLLCVIAGIRLNLVNPIDTNFLDLLPAGQKNPLIDAATQQIRSIFLRDLLLVVSDGVSSRAKQGAQAAQVALGRAGFSVSDLPHGAFKALALYREYHYAFLTSADLLSLKNNPIASFTSNVAGELASPLGVLGLSGSDPGGYLDRYLASLPRPYPNFVPDGPFMMMRRDGRSYFLLHTSLPEATIGGSGTLNAVNAVAAARAAVRKLCPGCTVLATGPVLFAAAARNEARDEVFWFTAASTLFIALLTLLIFRNLTPLVLVALSVGAGVLAGASSVIIAFGSIHILTLICGTTLLGVAVDYAFLYFAEHWFGNYQTRSSLAIVLPGLTMGLMTSVIAFAFLLMAGFPALTQIAIFSIVGLLTAYSTVGLVFPAILGRRIGIRQTKLLHSPQRLLRWANRKTRWRYIVPCLLLILAVPGLFQLHPDDNLGELQSFPKTLLRTDHTIQNLVGQVSPPGFFLVKGRNIQQALRREEAFFRVVTHQHPATSGIGLSRFLPSLARQEANLRIWAALFYRTGMLKHAFAHIGLPPELVDLLKSNWVHNRHTLLKAHKLLAAEPELKHFVVHADKQIALIATLRTPVKGKSILEKEASLVHGVSYIAPLQRLSDIFTRIRLRATWLVGISYLLISLILIWRYGRRSTLRMLYPPILTLSITLGALGWLNQPVNIFVIVGLILVLGVGRDYSVFIQESIAGSASTALGVTLSALATLCSFGMLSFSSIPALHAFGLTTLIGILTSYLSIPLSIAPDTWKAA